MLVHGNSADGDEQIKLCCEKDPFLARNMEMVIELLDATQEQTAPGGADRRARFSFFAAVSRLRAAGAYVHMRVHDEHESHGLFKSQ